MPNVKIDVLREAPKDIRALAEELAKLQKMLRYLLAGQIDFENIRARSIKAENIEVETITADEIAADAITTDKIEAGAVTAGKIDVDELSAISANLGTITAGSITTDTTINVGTDATIGNLLKLNETDGITNKGIVFNTNSGSETDITVQSGDMTLQAAGGYIILSGTDVFANGQPVANRGISVSVELLSSDGVTPVTLEFTGGTLRVVT